MLLRVGSRGCEDSAGEDIRWGHRLDDRRLHPAQRPRGRIRPGGWSDELRRARTLVPWPFGPSYLPFRVTAPLGRCAWLRRDSPVCPVCYNIGTRRADCAHRRAAAPRPDRDIATDEEGGDVTRLRTAEGTRTRHAALGVVDDRS
jgi:hypothetical protein